MDKTVTSERKFVCMRRKVFSVLGFPKVVIQQLFCFFCFLFNLILAPVYRDRGMIFRNAIDLAILIPIIFSIIVGEIIKKLPSKNFFPQFFTISIFMKVLIKFQMIFLKFKISIKLGLKTIFDLLNDKLKLRQFISIFGESKSLKLFLEFSQKIVFYLESYFILLDNKRKQFRSKYLQMYHKIKSLKTGKVLIRGTIIWCWNSIFILIRCPIGIFKIVTSYIYENRSSLVEQIRLISNSLSFIEILEYSHSVVRMVLFFLVRRVFSVQSSILRFNLKHILISKYKDIYDSFYPYDILENYLRICIAITSLSGLSIATFSIFESQAEVYDLIATFQSHYKFLLIISRFHYSILVVNTVVPMIFNTGIKRLYLFESSAIWICFLIFLSICVFAAECKKIYMKLRSYASSEIFNVMSSVYSFFELFYICIRANLLRILYFVIGILIFMGNIDDNT